MSKAIVANRPRFLYVFFGVFAVAVLIRALQLQYFDAEDNLARVGWNTESEVTLHAPRGAIWDRHGVPLAESVEAYNIDFDPREFYGSKREFAHELVGLFERFDRFDAEKFLSYAELPAEDIPRFMRVARGVSPQAAEHVKQEAARIGTRAVILSTTYERYYPLKGLAGSLVGFVDREGMKGRAGLESGLDDSLRGGELVYTVVRDVRRDPYLLGDLPDIDAIRGTTAELTIDVRLQEYTEDILQSTIEKYDAQEAMAVVSNVKTGELLSIASVPTVDPNNPFGSPEEYIWAPHAFSYAMEPGSTAKILTYAFAIDDGAVQANTMIDCEGGAIEVDGHTIRDTHDEEELSAHKVLEVSSNIGSWKIASKLGAEKHRKYLERAGIGTRPDLPISGQARGILPPLKWIDLQHANISFGHGFSASIVQLHNAIASIANGGVRMKPQLVRAQHHGDGRVDRTAPEVLERVVSERASRITLAAMHDAVYGEDGTGSAAKIPGVDVAGKTGTARLVDLERGGYLQEYLASFSGVFPANDPQYAITVWVLHPDTSIGYYGGRVAAPVFRSIGEEVLRLYSGDPSGWAKNASAAVAKLSSSTSGDADAAQGANISAENIPAQAKNTVPKLTGKRAADAVRILREREMPVKLHGSGRVAAQTPVAGGQLADGEYVVLQLAPEEFE